MKKNEKAKLARQRKQRSARRETHRAVGDRAPSLPGGTVRGASQYPLEGCWAQQDWREGGLAVVTVARRLPQAIFYAVLLVDYYCLGIKNANLGTEPSPERFRSQVLPSVYRATGGAAAISPDVAHELIYGALEYASRWGFRPHPAFGTARHLLDPQDAHPNTGQVVFGYQGRPLYVSGPHDHVEAIMAKLERAAGHGHYDYLLALGSPPDVDDDDQDEGWGDDADEGWPPSGGRE